MSNYETYKLQSYELSRW